MRSVALDLGKKITLCEVRDGVVVARATARELTDLKELFGANVQPARVAFEACLEARHVYKTLAAHGHRPVMLDTTRVRQLGIGHHKRKTDRIDAEVMAKALEAGRVHEAHFLSERAWELRQLNNVRHSLVKARAEFAVQAKAISRALGRSLGKAKPHRLPDTVEKLQDLPAEAVTLLTPLVASLSNLSEQIAIVDGRLEAAAAKDPVAANLATALGVGTVTATAFISVIDDPSRFKTAHQVEAYLGVVPAENSSSDKRAVGHITKQGNSYLRALLVQCAWTILRSRGDDPLKLWAEQVRARRGARVAVVALARRLAGVLWAMWRDNRPYDPKQLVGSANPTERVRRELWPLARKAAVNAKNT